MGTSTGYSAPPSWGDLKSDVTRAGGAGALTPNTAGELIQSFIQHNGGANLIARGTGGGGGGGGGGSVAKGGAARATARRLGGFISDVGRVGLEQALRNAGWTDLIGQPVPEILAALLDRLGGEASTIDDVDARMALARLQEKYFAEATDAAELDKLLVEQVTQLETVLHDFFGFYLYEVFCRVFFERLVQKLGETRAHSFLDQIRDFVNAALVNRAPGNDISKIDWPGAAGQALTADIMEATLNVFG